MFHPRWVGWYAAIKDILDTLPPTQPAPWQMARLPKALRESMLIGTGGYDGGIVSRHIDEPAFTLTHGGDAGSTGNSAQIRAFLVDGDNATSHSTGEPKIRAGDEPAMTMRGTRTTAHRAHIAGRWVRMTVQALGRFQTVPDDYRGLTAEINGNGVPCLLARRIMEHVRNLGI